MKEQSAPLGQHMIDELSGVVGLQEVFLGQQKGRLEGQAWRVRSVAQVDASSRAKMVDSCISLVSIERAKDVEGRIRRRRYRISIVSCVFII